MLRTNLATRPFYNVRGVRAAIAVLAAVVLGGTLLNLVQLIRLTVSQESLGARAADAEQESARLRQEAVRLRAQINPRELQTVANAAREANAIIERRAFSWTELFATFESALPNDVRITAVQPRLERDRFIVGVAIEARRAEDLDAFLEALEATNRFSRVLPTATQTNERGLLEAVVEGAYQPAVPGDATAKGDAR